MTEKIWNVQPDSLSYLRKMCTFPRLNHRIPRQLLNQPEAIKPPELQLGAIVKHKCLHFPQGQIYKIRWFPCTSKTSYFPGIYLYFVDTFPERFSVSSDELECLE